MTFQDLGLDKSIVEAVTKLGFESPTPIQEQAIPVLIQKDTDLVGLAQTGTGKTAAFGLPLLHNISSDQTQTQGLIICPTRELCLQITRDLSSFSKLIKKMKVVPVYGGTDIRKQIKDVKANPQVIVATPGRLIDLINRKAIKLNHISHVVLDEADEMLNMGFKEDIDAILDTTPTQKSVWLFSATMPKEVARIASNYMTDPFEITVGTKNESAKNIDHVYYTVDNRDKYNALKRIVGQQKDIFGVVFCRTRLSTQKVADNLTRDGYNAEALHGDLSQAQRDRVMDKFRSHTIKLLIATDVAARGIDVDDVTHVIHYQLPEDIENYTHRSGRTARAGKSGHSLCLISPREFGKVKAIQKKLNITFEQGTVPSVDSILNSQIMRYIDKVVKPSPYDNEKINQLEVIEQLFSGFTKEEVIKKFIINEFESHFKKRDKGHDLNLKPDKNAKEQSGRRSRGNRSNDANKVRFFVSLGSKNGLNAGGLIRTVCEFTGLQGKEIGRIDIKDSFSFFEADKEFKDGILHQLKGAKYEGQHFNVEEGNKNEGGGSSRGRSGGKGKGKRSGGGGSSFKKSNNRNNSRKGGHRKGNGGGKKKSKSERFF